MTGKQEGTEKVQIVIPAEVAKIMSKWGGHNVRLAAARGALPMSGHNLVTVLFVFYNGENQELKEEALSTLRTLPAQILLGALSQPELHPSIIDLIVKLRYQDSVVMQAALIHRMIGIKSLLFLAEHSSGDVLDMLAHNDEILRKTDSLRTAIINNIHTDKVTKQRLGWVEPEPEPEAIDETQPVTEADEDDASVEEELEEEPLSKYQELQEMTVTEKIKMALTGDKEWRTLLIREANKQVNTAVLNNPRITEGEVIAVAKNRSSSDELIRIILLNRDWVKLYEIKKALVVHPRTPLQTAMRYMSFLSEKDIKELSKSREVGQAIVNNARRMLIAKKR
ncbi:hypothetical protein [uncultured Desulfuromusa sp.]|uniref:hypothetical protein n=1 Tax=uncultured Desulfuromusa sp. TaxID=219183 RepID=UPI002AA8AFC8|nr:hypothetical protein [uncultured Desulfuromusa sp.]